MRFFVVAVAALALAGPAMAGTTYNDSTGENGAAADIANVVVDNDTSAQTVTFAVTVANMPTIETNAFVLIYLDTDRNAATGPNGFDYVFGLTATGYDLLKWDGTQLAETGASFQATYANGVLTAVIPTVDIGSPTAFDFFVATLRGPDPNNPVVDQAPDAPPIWTYTLATAPVVTPPATPPATAPTKVTISTTAASFSTTVPTDGKSFTVKGLTVDLSNGVEAKAKGMKCTATLAGKAFKGTGAGGCTFKLPKTAKQEKLSIHVTGLYGSTKLAKTYAFTVH